MDEEEIAQAKLQYQQLRNQQLQQGALSPEQGIRTAQDKLMSAILHNQPKQVFQDIQGIRDAPTSSIFAPVDRANALSTYMGGLAPTILGYAGTQDAYKDAATYYGKGVNIKDGLEEDLDKVDALRKEYNQDRIKAINDDKTLDWATKYRRTKDLATDFANDSRVQTIQGNLASFRNYQDKLQKMLAKGAKDGGITKETYDFLLQKARRDYGEAGGAYNDKGEMNQIDKHFGTPASYVDMLDIVEKAGQGWKADKGTNLRQTANAGGGYIYEQLTKDGWEKVDPNEVAKYINDAIRNDPMAMSHLKQQGELQAFRTNPEAYKTQTINQIQQELQSIMSSADPRFTPEVKAQLQKEAQANITRLSSMSNSDLEKFIGKATTEKTIGEYVQGGASKFGYTQRESEDKMNMSTDSTFTWGVDRAERLAKEQAEKQQWSYASNVGESSLKTLPDSIYSTDALEKAAGVSGKTYGTTNQGSSVGVAQYKDSNGNPISQQEYTKRIADAKEAFKNPATKFNHLYKNNEQFKKFIDDNGGIGGFNIGKADDYKKVFNQYNSFVKKNNVFEGESKFITDPNRRKEALTLAKSAPTLKIYNAKGELVEEGDRARMLDKYMGSKANDWFTSSSPDKDTPFEISSDPYRGLVISTASGRYTAVATPREIYNEQDKSGMGAMNIGLKEAVKTGKPQQVNQLVGGYSVPMVVMPDYKIRNDNKVGAKVQIDYSNSNLPANYIEGLKFIESQKGYITPAQIYETLGMKDPMQNLQWNKPSYSEKPE